MNTSWMSVVNEVLSTLDQGHVAIVDGAHVEARARVSRRCERSRQEGSGL
jgi:hypothetical protein